MGEKKKTEAVLASQSPRRRELICKVCAARVVPSSFDEDLSLLFGEMLATCLKKTPWMIPERLASEKAREVFSRTGGWVIGADTVVILDGELLGKPKDEEDAIRMLTLLSGKEHLVITGISVKSETGLWTASEITRVRFLNLKEEIIRAYVKSGLPLDKAGAYGIQDGYPLVEAIDGDYDNVVGLPVARLRKLLKESGFGGEIYGND